MDQSKLVDAELVERVLAGDKESFAALVERYGDALSSIAYLTVQRRRGRA